MKIEELRLGNYYQWYADGEYYYFQIKPEDFQRSELANFEPIQLTEKILLKSGFEKIIRKGCERYIHDDLDFEVERQGTKFAFCIWNEENPATTNFIMHCNWLHTFQNNFFALTNNELNIEL